MTMGSDYLREEDPRRNSEGYLDLTAYEALRNIEKCEKSIPSEKDELRFRKLLHTIFYLCELAGFQIEGRVVLRDKRTGRLWK
jgi:hypothetical protein